MLQRYFIRVFLFAFLFLVGFQPNSLFSQHAVPSVSAKFFINEYNKLDAVTKQNNELPQTFVLRHGLQMIDQIWHISAALKVNLDEFNLSQIEALDGFVGTILGDLVSVHLPIGRAHELLTLSGVIYVEMGAPGDAPVIDLAINDVGADTVKQGLGSISTPLNGNGVVVGVIDWGFDFGHPTYWDTSGTNYRLARVWDQNKADGPSPSGFSYGTEYTTEAAMLAAGHDDPYTFGIGSHGMHTSGIAAGSGLGTNLEGLASSAEIILLPYRRGAAGLMDGMSYVKAYADAENKPFVFNMSTGSHIGPHDGTSLKNQAITQIVGQGAAFVGSAGNNGSNNFHALADLDLLDTAAFHMIQHTINRNDYWGNALVMWGSPNEDFSVEVLLVSDFLDTVFVSGWVHSQDSPSYDSLFTINGDTVHVIFEGIASDPNNDKANIRLELKNKTGLNALVRLTGGGEVHCWNVARLLTRYTNWGEDLRSVFRGLPIAGGVNGDTDYGVGEPGGVGPSVISVGAYRSEEISQSGRRLHGNIASFSSHGPTVDGRVKPDITAPGVSVASSVSSFDTGLGQTFGNQSWNGKTYSYSRFSGTSMSGPVVAGVVALMFEANPSLHWHHVRDIIYNTARQDDNTGTLPSTGDMLWGWGKLNAYAAVQEALNTVGAKRFRGQADIAVYPNPSSDQIRVDMSHAPEVKTIRIADVNGRIIEQHAVNGQQSEYQYDVSIFSAGVYFLQAEDGSGHVSVYRVLVK